MTTPKMDPKLLDSIIMKMLSTVDGSKDEVFRIGEQSRQQYESLVEELKQIKQQVNEVMILGIN